MVWQLVLVWWGLLLCSCSLACVSPSPLSSLAAISPGQTHLMNSQHHLASLQAPVIHTHTQVTYPSSHIPSCTPHHIHPTITPHQLQLPSFHPPNLTTYPSTPPSTSYPSPPTPPSFLLPHLSLTSSSPSSCIAAALSLLSCCFLSL